jgi:hypothetical protein
VIQMFYFPSPFYSLLVAANHHHCRHPGGVWGSDTHVLLSITWGQENSTTRLITFSIRRVYYKRESPLYYTTYFEYLIYNMLMQGGLILETSSPRHLSTRESTVIVIGALKSIGLPTNHI